MLKYKKMKKMFEQFKLTEEEEEIKKENWTEMKAKLRIDFILYFFKLSNNIIGTKMLINKNKPLILYPIYCF